MVKHVKIILIGLCLASNTHAQVWKDSVEVFREKYKKAFLEEANSPLKADDLQYLQFYEPDSLYQVEGSFSKISDGTIFKIPTSNGKFKEYVKYGEVSFAINGKALKLNVYRSLALMQIPKYRDYLFVPIKDQTSGKETYGAGRYLDASLKDIKEGKIQLDFNKLYNPYCAFSEGYSCPIPPKENHLPIRIEAGEKLFLKEKGNNH
ncbi:DUF1684 domain-containing protein [Flectobacillus longus]|uniref:DUF1684 domain-containing protein n=1 Tax=Flectobacillus longus TaxID=2984207 RepID=UPI0024B84F0D|nr:DUF1684 domain-containing protein [Flectobacillus longus]MDI9881193.1 DUF1684 domain-containing protein [Flectobacillus longus]